MQSQARKTDHKTFWDRHLVHVATANVYQLGRAWQNAYDTALDAQIADLEQSATTSIKGAILWHQAARRWAARGDVRAADCFAYARSRHDHARQCLRDRARLIVKRNAAMGVSHVA